MTAPLLLDTHALIWWMTNDPALPQGVRRRIGDPRVMVYVSAASVWEVSIKARRGRLEGVGPYLERHAEYHRAWGFTPVAIEPEDARVAGQYPFEHADPFDRVLLAQAERLDVALASADRVLASLSQRVIWD